MSPQDPFLAKFWFSLEGEDFLRFLYDLLKRGRGFTLREAPEGVWVSVPKGYPKDDLLRLERGLDALLPWLRRDRPVSLGEVLWRIRRALEERFLATASPEWLRWWEERRWGWDASLELLRVLRDWADLPRPPRAPRRGSFGVQGPQSGGRLLRRLVRLGRLLGWPEVAYWPHEKLLGGRENWRKFLSFADVERMRAVCQKLASLSTTEVKRDTVKVEC